MDRNSFESTWAQFQQTCIECGGSADHTESEKHIARLFFGKGWLAAQPADRPVSDLCSDLAKLGV